jgi:hypothetical protein
MIAGQLDEARAVVGHLQALVDLYTMDGTLLERRRIGDNRAGRQD